MKTLGYKHYRFDLCSKVFRLCYGQVLNARSNVNMSCPTALTAFASTGWLRWQDEKAKLLLLLRRRVEFQDAS